MRQMDICYMRLLMMLKNYWLQFGMWTLLLPQFQIVYKERNIIFKYIA